MQGNLALKVAQDMRTPVRVCRAAGIVQRDGLVFRLYAYEGLYLVTDMRLCALCTAASVLALPFTMQLPGDTAHLRGGL